MMPTDPPIAPLVPDAPGPAPWRERPEEEAQRMYVTVERWTNKHMPETDPEEALIRASAIEHVRYLRCVEVDERILLPRAREAMAEWEERRRHSVRRRAQGLRDDPAGTVLDLSGSAFGIDWMLRHWRALLELLRSGRGWRGDDLVLALQLMGRPPRAPLPDDVEGRALWDLASASCPSTVDAAAARGIVGPPEAAEGLIALVADRIGRLDALRPAAWEQVEGPELEALKASSMVDTSPEGLSRQRLRREALRDMTRCLSLIMRLRVERSRMDARLDRSAPCPAPAAPAVPTAASKPVSPRPMPVPRPAGPPSPSSSQMTPECDPGPVRSPDPSAGQQDGSDLAADPTQAAPGSDAPPPLTADPIAEAEATDAEPASPLPEALGDRPTSPDRPRNAATPPTALSTRPNRVKFEDARRLRRSVPGAPEAHRRRTEAHDDRLPPPPLAGVTRRLPPPNTPEPPRSRPRGDPSPP